jgi:hypothetical protein
MWGTTHFRSFPQTPKEKYKLKMTVCSDVTPRGHDAIALMMEAKKKSKAVPLHALEALGGGEEV